jgi:O-antigen ligase
MGVTSAAQAIAPVRETAMERAAFLLTWASAVSVLFSIAVSQILLALALATLLVSGVRLRLPPIWLPLALFMVGTLLSLAMSEDPWMGRPQVRKFFVYLLLLAVFSTFRRVSSVRWLVFTWAIAGSAAASLALVQFGRKMQEAGQHGQSFYEYYVPERITGFMSHWMTFGGAQMIVLIMLGAFLLFSPGARGRGLWIGLLAACVLSVALVLNFTRSIWIAMCVAGLYLVWQWKRRVLLAAPVLVAVILWVNPGSVRDRFTSTFQPRQEVDSNQHRIVCWRTGWEMIRAHPWFGVGPQLVESRFNQYVPAELRPIPNGWYGHLHNIYIQYAAERGVAVALVLLWLLLKVVVDFYRAARLRPPGPSDARFVLHGGVAVVLAIMVGGLFEHNLGDSEVLSMFLAVVGGGYVAAQAPVEEQVG